MAQATGTPDRPTLLAFGGAVVIGGANFIAVRYSNEELAPLFGATLRFATAALLFLVIAFMRRTPLPKGKAAVGAILYGLLGFGVAYAMLYKALVGLSAGMTSAIVASVPLATLVLAVVHGQERFSTRGLVGGALAVAGIGVLSLRAFNGEIRPIYFILALIGVLAIAESTVIVKGFPRADPVATNGLGMGMGAALLAIASLISGEEWVVPRQADTWLALAYLVVVGSVCLFVLYLYVITRWTASATNYAITLMPIVAVTLGVLIADERLTIEVIAGAALVLAAVYIGALSKERGGSEADDVADARVEIAG